MQKQCGYYYPIDCRKKHVLPERYVYHKSPAKNRNDIRENGLIPFVGNSYFAIAKKNKNSRPCIPAIFVSNTGKNGKLFAKHMNWDIWSIDTTQINNLWFIDKHMQHKNKNYLVTFEKISPHSLKLINHAKEKNS